MKKIILVLATILLWVSPLYAATDGHTKRGPVLRPEMVFFRGVGNLAAIPLEPFTSLGREFETHHWLWPVTFPFRLVNNVIVRSTSAVVDLFVNPWIVPFTDDISPLTEPMGLPDYPWQVH